MSTNAQNQPFGSPLESILPLLESYNIIVQDFARGFVECPGVDHHTTANAPHDCVAYSNDGVPYLHCFHHHCLPVREALHHEWRRVARRQQTIPGRFGRSQTVRAQQRTQEAARANDAREQRLAASMLPAVLEEYDWSAKAVEADSPDPVTLPVGQHWQLILCLFAEDDVVWIGRDQYDSGSPGHRWRFCRSLDWLSKRTCPGRFICPSTFRPGVHQRERKDVLSPKFLVVESDTLGRDQVGAVFRWIESSLSLPLRAVVDSGNKSLHGWFDYPPPGVFQKLRLWLPAMGCDPAMFAPNQPCRLPGAWRTEAGRFQRLLYLA